MYPSGHVLLLYIIAVQKRLLNLITHSLLFYKSNQEYINGLSQDSGNSSALTMELLQSCTKPLIYDVITVVNVGL